MSISASVTERIDACSPYTRKRPGNKFCGNPDMPAIKVNPLIWFLEPKIWRNSASFQAQDGFNDTRQPTATLQMADVCFEASNKQLAIFTIRPNLPRVAPMAPASMGSPAWVPVP